MSTDQTTHQRVCEPADGTRTGCACWSRREGLKAAGVAVVGAAGLAACGSSAGDAVSSAASGAASAASEATSNEAPTATTER